MAQFESVHVNGSPMRICMARPDRVASPRCVILMCHITGLDDFTAVSADRLATAGFLVAAPDVFHYTDWIEEREARRATLRDTRILDDINATIAHLDTTCTVADGPMAIMGHCMGGRTALLGAGNIDRFGPLVMLYGGRTMLCWGGDGPTPFERIPHVRGPVAGFFGQDDQEPSPADVDRIESEFRAHDIPCTFHRYDGAGHAFQNFDSPERYREQASEDAWDKLLTFLDGAY